MAHTVRRFAAEACDKKPGFSAKGFAEVCGDHTPERPMRPGEFAMRISGRSASRPGRGFAANRLRRIRPDRAARPLPLRIEALPDTQGPRAFGLSKSPEGDRKSPPVRDCARFMRQAKSLQLTIMHAYALRRRDTSRKAIGASRRPLTPEVDRWPASLSSRRARGGPSPARG